MQRVLLVIDDYNELIYIQTLLKKLGFDVEGLQNAKKYADVSLGFNPHVLVTTCRGSKVDGLFLTKDITKNRGLPKIIGLKASGQTFANEELLEAGIDILIESPISPKRLIQALAQVVDLDEQALLEKYSKIKGMPQQGGEIIGHLFDENGQPIEALGKIKSAIAELTGPLSLSRQQEKSKIETDQNSIKNESKFNLKNSGDNSDDKIQNKIEHQREERFADWIAKVGSLPKQNFDRDRIREFNKKMRSVPLPEDVEVIENEKKKFVEALFKK